uniref:Uncharacterized protein n=1 Tax=Arundo donax TaxID=35708 RepID=A0A0A9CHM1_ARUDO
MCSLITFDILGQCIRFDEILSIKIGTCNFEKMVPETSFTIEY